MSELNQLSIVATGMLTPVGLNSEMTAASIRAGINTYETSTMHNGKIDAIKMAQIPEEALPPLKPQLRDVKGLTARQNRMIRIGGVALEEVLQSIPKTESMPLFLAGPEPLPDAELPIRSSFIEYLQFQANSNFDLENSKVFPMGRAAVFYALEAAFAYLESNQQEYVLVGGVESYWHPMTLSALGNEKRIQTEPGEPNAFVPGEGAGFICLSKSQQHQNARKICRPGIAAEVGHRYSDEPYQGDGLTNAFKLAISHSGVTSIGQIYSSLNGESFGAKEYGVAVTRNSADIQQDCNHVHPADCYGDLGGASGAVLLALSSMISSQTTLCYGSSDDEFRGAACVI